MNLDSVSKIYKTKNKEVVGLDNVSYSFLKGKFYAIMGHSGSGKSTLIKIMGLIDTLTSGTYTIEGKDVSKLKEEELAELRKQYIGFIFQDFYLDENLKAYENVMVPMLINKEIKSSERKNKAISLLKSLGLEDRCNHYPREMSGGEQQRVSIARALANDPVAILADEPTGNLDEENEKRVFEDLKNLTKMDKCVVVVSHSNFVREYADVVLNISHGKINEE